MEKDPSQRGRAPASCEGEGKRCVTGHQDHLSEGSLENVGGWYVQGLVSLDCNDSTLIYPATGTGYVEEATETAVATAIRELKAVLTCQRQLEGRTINLRFVKCEGVDLLADYNHISSTTVRDVMSKEHGIKLREALDWMALSADLLWRCKDSWIDKARLGTGCCINFQESTEELRLPETPRSYESPPSFDEPRSPEELELVEANEESPSIEKPPSLENPTSHEITPSFEELPPKNEKKRRFSATGLEADIEVLEELVGRGIFAEDAEV